MPHTLKYYYNRCINCVSFSIYKPNKCMCTECWFITFILSRASLTSLRRSFTAQRPWTPSIHRTLSIRRLDFAAFRPLSIYSHQVHKNMYWLKSEYNCIHVLLHAIFIMMWDIWGKSLIFSSRYNLSIVKERAWFRWQFQLAISR